MKRAAFLAAALALAVGCGPGRTRAAPEDSPAKTTKPETVDAGTPRSRALWPTAAVSSLMRGLLANPGAVPPMKQPSPTGAQLTFVVRADRSPRAVRATALRSPDFRVRIATARERAVPPHSWLVAFDRTTGTPLYWTAVEDPFRYLAERAGPDGEVISGMVRRREGLVSAVLPFTRGACVAWLVADGTASLMHPEAYFCFGDEPAQVSLSSPGGGGGP